MYTYYSKERIYQGDIFKNIEIDIDFKIIDNKVNIKKLKLPYSIVMTQDCDLQQDYENRKSSNVDQRTQLFSILLCPVFNSDDLRKGNHLKDIEIECKNLNSSLWNPVKKNRDKRYYFLNSEKVFLDQDENDFMNIDDLIIDFKLYQTISRDKLYDKLDQYYVSINPLFREEISDRFTHYLGRIGLPEKSKTSPQYRCDTFCDTY